MKELLWVEKYRPQILDNIIGQDINKVKKLISNPSEMPHFLFVSRSAGTGKTSLAKAIQKEIGLSKMDFLTCNSSDERKIEFIRNNVKQFAMSMRSDKAKPKIILMDEFDGMLKASQDMMKGLMEKYVSNTRFILTANSEEAIIEPIRSRCTIIRFREPPKDAIYKRLMFICENETIPYNEDGINKLIDTFYPDIRSMINKLQELSSVGIDKEYITAQNDIEVQFFKLLTERKPFTVMQYVADNNLANIETLRACSKKIEELATTREQASEMIFFIAETAKAFAIGSDKEIVFNALIVKWLEIFK